MDQQTPVASGPPKRNGLLAIAIVCAALVASGITALAYRPGLMTWDAVRQYDQALSGRFDDWHPPAMEWLWRQFVPLLAGPGPMLALQLCLFWGGVALLATWALRRDRIGLAAAIVACGALPLPMALMGAVLKDCLMAGALLAASGLLVWRGEASAPRAAMLGAIGGTLVLAAATLRFNAFLAGLPLMVAVLPRWTRRTPLRFAATSAFAAIALLAAMPVANRLVGARPSGVELSLVIFDLGGITQFSGVNAFPPLADVPDPVATSRRCYMPVRWDSYAWWVEEPCAIGFANVGAALKAQGIGPYAFLAHAIAAHPIAYARHRIAHFNINTRFLVPDDIERAVQVESAPNRWGYAVTPNPVLSTIDAAALVMARTPLGWPIVWITLAIGILGVSSHLPSCRIVIPLASSAVMYGMGYAVFSVASEFRYNLWTMMASALAMAITASDLHAGAAVPRVRLFTAFAPVAVVVLLGTVWRIT